MWINNLVIEDDAEIPIAHQPINYKDEILLCFLTNDDMFIRLKKRKGELIYFLFK